MEAGRLEIRRIKSEPLIDELINLANSNIGKVLPESKTGQAFGYLIGLKPYLKNYLTHPMARLDNNKHQTSKGGDKEQRYYRF